MKIDRSVVHKMVHIWYTKNSLALFRTSLQHIFRFALDFH